MNTLRWILGLILVLIGSGHLLLLIFTHGLRKSFGSSNPFIAVLPFLATAILLAALVWPENHALLHAGAAVAVVLIGLCVWQIVSASATILLFGIFYLITWLAFYGWAGWREGPALVSTL